MHTDPTDKYGAAARASFVITVLPPNITSNPAEFVDDFLNSSVQLAIDRGDLDTVSTQSGALIDVLNSDNPSPTTRPEASDSEAEEERMRRFAPPPPLPWSLLLLLVQHAVPGLAELTAQEEGVKAALSLIKYGYVLWYENGKVILNV